MGRWSSGHIGSRSGSVGIGIGGRIVYSHRFSLARLRTERDRLLCLESRRHDNSRSRDPFSIRCSIFFIFFFIIIIFVFFFFHLCEILQVLFGNRFWVVEFLLKRKRTELIVCDIGCNEIVDRLGVH